MSGSTSPASRNWFRVGLIAVVAFAAGVGLRTLFPDREEAAARGSAAEAEAGRATVADAKAVARPALAEVLAAPADAVLAVAARYLRGAPREEIVALAEAWDYEAGRAPVVAWKLLLACWVEKDAPGALEAARRIGGGDAALELFALRTWAEVDPAAAVAAAEKEPERLLAEIIGIVAKGDLAVALGVLERHPDSEGIVMWMLPHFARNDPRGAMAWAETVPDAKLRKKAMGWVATIWAGNDGLAALAWLEERGAELEESEQLKGVIIAGLVQWDVNIAEQHVAAMEAGSPRYDLMVRMAEIRSRTNPEEALAWATSLPAGNERRAALSVCVKAAAGGDSEKLLALFDEHGWDLAAPNAADEAVSYRFSGKGGGGREQGSLNTEAKDAILRLARDDPEKAMRYCGRLTTQSSLFDASPRASMLTGIAVDWFAREPAAALAWLGSVPVDKTVREVSRYLIGRLNEEQTQWIFDNAETLEPGPLLREVLRNKLLDGVSFAADPNRFIALAESLEGEDRAAAIGELARSLAGSDPERAFRLLETLPSGRDRESTIASVIGALPLERSRPWFDSLAPTDKSASACGTLTSRWMEKDVEGATRWATALPPGESRDAAVSAVASRLAFHGERDMGTALQWAMAIDGKAARHAELESLYTEWMNRDVKAARAAIESSELSDRVKVKLLAQ